MSGFDSLVKALRRWGGTDDTNADNLSRNSGSRVVAIAQAVDRQLVVLRGEITRLETKPRNGIPWLEAEISDASGQVTLVWMGRKSIPGIAAGHEIQVSGRLTNVDGIRRLYNPHYELLRR